MGGVECGSLWCPLVEWQLGDGVSFPSELGGVLLSQDSKVLPNPGLTRLGGTRHPPHTHPLLTHITLVLPAVLPLMVRVAHAAIAVDVDITWGSEGLSQEWGCREGERLASHLPPSP